MGKKDLWQSDYFDDKARFADMINGALFCGKQVVKTKKGVRFHMCKAWDDHKESGRQEAINEGLTVLVSSLKKFTSDLNVIYTTVIENEWYRNVTLEQVKDCYYAK